MRSEVIRFLLNNFQARFDYGDKKMLYSCTTEGNLLFSWDEAPAPDWNVDLMNFRPLAEKVCNKEVLEYVR